MINYISKKAKIIIRRNATAAKICLRSLSMFERIYRYSHNSILDMRVIKLCDIEYNLGGRLQVIDGPFKGLIYPSLEATGSALGLKIIGIYEEELNPIFEDIIGKYDEVWDVGAAEGYYAIGMAVVDPHIKVKAFDIEKYARKLLHQMSVANKCDDRVEIGSWCTPEIINEAHFKNKTLIICDCEGYEKELLSYKTVDSLRNVDILVEVHDNIDEGQNEIGEQIKNCFKDTHDITVIESLFVYDKAKRNENNRLFKNLTDKELVAFMREREWHMNWFYMTPKSTK